MWKWISTITQLLLDLRQGQQETNGLLRELIKDQTRRPALTPALRPAQIASPRPQVTPRTGKDVFVHSRAHEALRQEAEARKLSLTSAQPSAQIPSGIPTSAEPQIDVPPAGPTT